MDVSQVITQIFDFVKDYAEKLLHFLPTSPFRPFIMEVRNSFSTFAGYINYFIPIGFFIDVFYAWMIAVFAFYAYSLLMRWVKMIGS